MGDQNSAFGAGAGLNITFGDNNSFFGRHAGLRTTGFASDNSFFGSGAGEQNTEGIRNSFFGKDAGLNSKGNNNSFFGYRVGESTTGIQNCFYGNFSGHKNTSGSHNAFFGEVSGRNNISGEYNAFFGARAGQSSIGGAYNTLIGFSTGWDINGSSNSFLGAFAGYWIEGSGNIVIGRSAGPPQDSSTVSHRLYIDNHTSSTPLIYGELDNHLVRINGAFEVTAGLSNPSSRHLKTDFQEVSNRQILDKIAGLAIKQWVYKERPDELHVGPVAEDFYATFALGTDNKHISTIDADGVMMAAIQALKAENDELNSEKEQLELRIQRLEKIVFEIQPKVSKRN